VDPVTADEEVKALARLAVDYGDRFGLCEIAVEHLIELVSRVWHMGQQSASPEALFLTDPPVAFPYRGEVQ
jgi:hypothetical protein